jgi:hypothetical protein
MPPKTVDRTRKVFEPGFEPGERGEPFRAAGAAVASLPRAAPPHPAAEPLNSNGNGENAAQERDRRLEAWAREHDLVQRTGESRSKFRVRVLLEQAKAQSRSEGEAA